VRLLLELIRLPHARDVIEDLLLLGVALRPAHERVEAVHERADLQARAAVDVGPDADEVGAVARLEERHVEAVPDEMGGRRDTRDARADDGDAAERLLDVSVCVRL